MSWKAGGPHSREYTDFTVVIVLDVRGRVIGAVVDSVSDVLALGADSIKPAPQMNASMDAGHIMGMGCVKSGDVERMLLLADIEALMSSAPSVARRKRWRPRRQGEFLRLKGASVPPFACRQQNHDY